MCCASLNGGPWSRPGKKPGGKFKPRWVQTTTLGHTHLPRGRTKLRERAKCGDMIIIIKKNTVFNSAELTGQRNVTPKSLFNDTVSSFDKSKDGGIFTVKVFFYIFYKWPLHLQGARKKTIGSKT